MKDRRQPYNKGKTKAARMLIALCLCVVMLPLGVFAEDGPVPDSQGPDSSYEQGQNSGTDGQETGSEGSGENGNWQGTDQENGQGTPEPGGNAGGEPSGSGQQEEQAQPQTSGETTEEAAQGPEDEEEQQPAPSRKARSFKWSGLTAKFNTDVLIDEPLGAESRPARASVTGQKKSIKVFWTQAPDITSVDGYIVLRKNGSTYNEIARVSNGKITYTDRSAKKKNTGYYYTVVGYKKTANGIRISQCAPWTAGVTTRSKLKNGYTATINKNKATLQAGGSVRLSLKYSKPKKTYLHSTFRWISDDPSVASVDSKGNVKAVKEGSVTIRGRLASGRDITCTLTVVGAFKPGTPSPEVDYATEDSIWLMWSKTGYANSYDIYRSDDGGETFGEPVNVTGTEYTDTGLTAEHEYIYYVQARNDNCGYTALSDKSADVVQKAVKTPRRTRMHGLKAKDTAKAGSAHTISFSVVAPDGRKAELQEQKSGSWTTAATVTLPAGAAEATSSVTYPDTWWYQNSTTWRIHIPASEDAMEYTSPMMTLTTARRYQNPKGYVQITNTISKHGHSYYTSPVLVNNMSTKSDHIEAMIKTAYKYKGDKYANRWSREPGKGVDCSGLVMQACYGAGVDLWPSNPYRHRYGAAKYEWESREIAKMKNLKTVAYKDRKRGDLIFFCNSKGTVIHVAIYLGNNQIIHSTTVGGRVKVSGMGGGAYGRVCKVKRIFN